jgi:unsaturated chondroitin disaccharide hydrolase
MLFDNEKQWVNEVVEKITSKMEWVSEKSKEKIPYTTLNGTHDDKSDALSNSQGGNGINWWTNGFWGGMLWIMYHETGEEKYAQIARVSEIKLDKCFENYYGLHHDVGFMWLLTAVANYRLTKDEDARRRGLHAASLLAGRFNPAGKFIRAWNGIPDGLNDNRGWAIIDCMLNLPILYWASQETKDPRFKQIAMMHADTAMEYFIREDGSVKHIVEFEPETGNLVRDYGGQGYALGSSWTRGQAWGLYGFMMSYIHTGKEEYLNTSKKIANYFIANIPESDLIPIDFRQPSEPNWEDSTAAAIAACGLIEIAKHVPDVDKQTYFEPALKMLRTLDERRCNWSTDNDSMVQHCCEAYHKEKQHISLIYGDYFFMEAIFKLKGNDIFFW